MKGAKMKPKMTYDEWRESVEKLIIAEMSCGYVIDNYFWEGEYKADYRAGLTPEESAKRAIDAGKMRN